MNKLNVLIVNCLFVLVMSDINVSSMLVIHCDLQQCLAFQ